MEVKSGYKQTEVGVIPQEWDTTSLEAVCAPGGLVRGPFGGSLKKEIFVSSGKKVYEQRNAIYRDAGIGSYFIDESRYKELQRFAVSPGEFIVSCAGTIGRIFRIPVEAQSGVINQALLKLRTDGEVVDSDFFYHYFDWERFQRRIIDNTHGGAMQNLVGMDLFRSVEFPLPSLPEQRAIATALSDVDGLLGGLERLIAKKRDLKQAAMQQLLTGQTRLPGFHAEWEVKRLGTLLQFQVGFPFSSAFFNEKGEGIRLVKNRDLKSDDQVFHYNGMYEEAFVIRDGDVLIGMDGDFLPCQWNKGPALLNQRVGRVVPNTGLNVAFAFYALIEPLKEIEIVTSCTTVKHLSHGDVEGIERPLPPLPEQTAIASVLTEMDGELAALEQRREKTRALKQAMMQELLTGKTRLI